MSMGVKVPTYCCQHGISLPFLHGLFELSAKGVLRHEHPRRAELGHIVLGALVIISNNGCTGRVEADI